MTGGIFVVDTNVVVSGVVSVNAGSPPSRILDAMLDGRIIHLMSGSLLAEYSQVLRRPDSRLVTGDRRLLENPLRPGAVLTPREAALAIRSA